MAIAQTTTEVVDDLRDGWMVYTNGSYRPFTAGPGVSAIYFTVDPGRYQSGSVLKVSSAKPFSLYLNQQLLLLKRRVVHIDLDSLRAKESIPWQFGIHQPAPLSWLSTGIISPGNEQTLLANQPRPPYYFLDFTIMAVLALLLIFVMLFRNNPKLTIDYFNIVRLFSIQEREDALLTSRLLSSVNLLYYGFASLLTSLTLLILFRYGAEAMPAAEYFIVKTRAEGFVQWLRLSVLIFFVLLIKLWILVLLGSLFQVADKTAAQFYNYIRLVFFVFGMAGIGCVAFFTGNVQDPGAYAFLLKGIIVLLSFWVLIASLKLMSRTSLRFFQLFSYLCASELIPVVFIIKVLNS